MEKEIYLCKKETENSLNKIKDIINILNDVTPSKKANILKACILLVENENRFVSKEIEEIYKGTLK